MSKFALSDEGRSYLQIYMKPNKRTTLSRVQFKVDTGADFTTISKKELVLLGYSYEWLEEHMKVDVTHTLSRAGGKPQPAYYIQITVSNILGRELLNWPFYIRKERDLDFPNLLGLNLLIYFNICFDYREWTFTIEHIDKPGNKIPMLPDQLICSLENMDSQ